MLRTNLIASHSRRSGQGWSGGLNNKDNYMIDHKVARGAGGQLKSDRGAGGFLPTSGHPYSRPNTPEQLKEKVTQHDHLYSPACDDQSPT